MAKLLFIYNNPLDGSYGGSQRTKLAFSGLKENFEVIQYSCIKKSNKILTLIRNILGYSGNLSKKDIKKIIKLISDKETNIECVFFDVSLHGKLVKILKSKFPNIKLIINYHNCESQYFEDMYKTNGILYYPIYKSAIKNETLSKKYGDYHVLITNEDRIQLNINNNYTVIPVTLQDTYKDTLLEDNTSSYLLFVGAAVYANIEASKYIIEKIASNIDKKILIVGKGMKSVFPNNYKNVEIKDFITSLDEVYKNASAFISPLFYGSGAKVKVAEAFMYGKKIIGTRLTFYGYDLSNAVYSICDNEQDFINEINKLEMDKKFYIENRKLYCDKYDSINNGNYYSKIKTDLNIN